MTYPEPQVMTDHEIAELWHCFIIGGRCSCHRSRLMAVFFPMAKRIAGSFRKRSGSPIDYDELVSLATFGLIHAIDTWDPNREVRFESWAAVQIRGRILDEVRTQDWAPRTVRRRQRELDTIYEYALLDLGREPTYAELAELLKTTETDVRLRHQEVEAAKLRSLDEPLDPFGANMLDPEETAAGFDEVELRDLMRRIVLEASLDLDMYARFVLVLYYIEGLSLEQVARVIGLAEHRVSKIHADTVMVIRSTAATVLRAEAVV